MSGHARRWHAGWRGWVDNIEYRVVPGRKSGEDLRLEHYVQGEWMAVAFEGGFLLADFFCQNEDGLFPRAEAYAGGSKYLAYCYWAACSGWEAPAKKVAADKERKKRKGFFTRRDELPPPDSWEPPF